MQTLVNDVVKQLRSLKIRFFDPCYINMLSCWKQFYYQEQI